MKFIRVRQLSSMIRSNKEHMSNLTIKCHNWITFDFLGFRQLLSIKISSEIPLKTSKKYLENSVGRKRYYIANQGSHLLLFKNERKCLFYYWTGKKVTLVFSHAFVIFVTR